MAEDTPHLAEFLASQRNNAAPCWCEQAHPDLVQQVNAAYESGSRQWAGILRWLENHDVVTTKFRLSDHFDKGHHRG